MDMDMRKTADYLSTLSPHDASHGEYRVRIYEEDGALPLVVVTNPTPGEVQTPWLTNEAPRLAAFVAQKDLPSAKGLRWVTRYPSSSAEAPAELADLYESSTFAVIAPGQVAYREPPRFGEQAPMEPQASLCCKADIEALIGQTLD
jgi:hypothetical protein